MPTPDASQFTQLKRYVAIEGDAATSAGSKTSPFNTFYTRIPSAAASNTTFLPSANRNLKQGLPPLPPLPTITILLATAVNGDTYNLTWTETGATSREATCITNPGGISVPTAITNLSDGACTITNKPGSNKGPYTVTITVTNAAGSASESVNLSYALPTISNLIVASGGNYGDLATLTWGETYTTSRSATCVKASNMTTPVSDAISLLAAGSCTVTNQSFPLDGPYSVTITVTNVQGSSSATITVSVGCFLGFVKVKTLDGPVAVEDIVVGTKILQPSGRYSNVVELKRTTITDMLADGDGRLYADAEEKMVVTYWHKVRFSDETEEVKAGEHPRLHQVFRPTPFDVFHIKLEDPVRDKVLIYDTDITAEGFVPVNPL